MFKRTSNHLHKRKHILPQAASALCKNLKLLEKLLDEKVKTLLMDKSFECASQYVRISFRKKSQKVKMKIGFEN